MRECKVLQFHIDQEAKSAKTLNLLSNGNGFSLYDLPEVEKKVNAYLADKWVISGFSVEKAIAEGATVGPPPEYLFILLTR